MVLKKRIISLTLIMAFMLGLFAMVIPQKVMGATSTLTISDEGLEYLKREEGFGRKPYWDYKQYTVGYGTKCPDDKYEEWMKNGITRKEAEELLRDFLVDIEDAVNNDLIAKYNLTLTQSQFDALICFSYNVGWSWIYKPNSNIHKAIVKGQTRSEIVRALSLYSKAGGELLPALAKRRMRDANMYFNADYSTYKPTEFGYVYYDTNGGKLDYQIQGFDVYEEPSPVKNPTYSGHKFMGWYTAKIGGVKVTKLTKEMNTWTLYARWDDEDLTEKPMKPIEVKVTGTTVNLREGPGTNYNIIGKIYKNDCLTITEVTSGTGYKWGKSEIGWICLMYTNFEEVVNSKQDDADSTTPSHTHTYIEEIVVAPTCTKSGRKTFTCSCKESYSEQINPTGHQYKQEVTKPTCETDGYTKHACVNCGNNYVDSYIKAIGHCYKETIIAPTCVGSGYTTNTCENCNHSYVSDKTKALGHIWGKWIVDKYPTTEKVGSEIRTCSSCNKHETRETEKLKPLVGKVRVDTYLCIRKGPGTSYSIVGRLYNNNKVEILEQKKVNNTTWGKIDKGWISLRYIVLENNNETNKDTVTTPSTITATVKVSSRLRVRSIPSVSGKITGYLFNNDKVIIAEQTNINGVKWGKVKDGWINMQYVEIDKNQQSSKHMIKTVTADCLRIRKGAGTNTATVGYLYSGDKIEILDTEIVNGVTWGKTNRGWISMKFVI